MNSQILKNTNAKLLDEFNASIMFDKELYPYDIAGSIAHSKMLALQGIITISEQEEIERGLMQVKKEIESGEFEWKIEDEDLHMAIEGRLTQIIGDSGKKLHTARSRNDQVITDFRLYVKNSNQMLMKKLTSLIQTIVDVSKDHTTTLLPGMTHLQHAQPINFGYHLLAYAQMFKRDFSRIEDARSRADYSPLGSAALAGTPHNIDRNKSCELLGFKAPTSSALDTVSDRDFALDILYNISMIMMHISRLSEEMILWASYEFKFISMSDEYATTSSIMPQKKNPDVPELLRGKSGRVYGNLIGLLTVMKSLPLAYNKDTQEDKEGVFDSVKTAEISLDILNEVIKSMIVHEDKMYEACKVGHLSATDLADYLVQKNAMPFREAYYITKSVVAKADELKKDMSELSVEELRASHELLSNVSEELLGVLSLRSSMNARDSYGGTSTKMTEVQIDELSKWLDTIS
jgi:argininosuccinate lyase